MLAPPGVKQSNRTRPAQTDYKAHRGVVVPTDTWPLPKHNLVSQGCAAHVLLLLQPGRGKVESGAETQGQFKPRLKELGAQDLTCPAALLGSLPRAQHTQAFPHFQGPQFSICSLLTAHFRKAAYGWVVEHSSDLFQFASASSAETAELSRHFLLTCSCKV